MKFLAFIPLLFVVLTGCSGKGIPEKPEAVAAEFWEAAKEKRLDNAKQLVTWNTAKQLAYFADERVVIADVELLEIQTQDQIVAIDTVIVLERKGKDNLRLPTKTIIVKTEDVWRVELNQTLSEVVQQSAAKLTNQLNQMFQQGLNELDKALAETVHELSGSIEQGAKELGTTLEQNADELSNALKQFQKDMEQYRQSSPRQ